MPEDMKNPESSPRESVAETTRSLEKLLDDIHRSRSSLFARSMDSHKKKDDNDRIALESELVGGHKKLIAKHKKTLELLGLVCDIEESDLTLHAEEESWNLPQIVLRLENGDKFISYLRALDPSMVSSTEIDVLNEIIDRFLQDLDVMGLQNPLNPNVIEFLGKLSRIAPELERLSRLNSLSHSFEKLQKYIEPIRGKYLKEYLIARAANILPPKPNEGFGPDTWQNDTTLERFRDVYWMDALSAIDEISKNPNARSFLSQILNCLRDSVNYARDSIIRNSKRDRNHARRMQGFIEVLDEAEAAINSLASTQVINVKPEIKTES